MAKTKEQKAKLYQQYKESLDTYQTYVLLDMNTIKTQSVEGFKNKLSETKSKYFLIKNTLFQKAVEEKSKDINLGSIEGSTGVVFTSEDASVVFKEVMGFIKENPAATVKVGVIDNQQFDAEKVIEISKLPSRLELIAKVVGATKSPLYSIVNVLNGAQRNFVYTLKALEAKKSE